MKRQRRWLSALLAVVMTAALLCVPTFAANRATNAYGIQNYVALGDSIATGLNDNTFTYQDAYGSWENGITQGISSVAFAPLQSCTRAQAVTFLFRYCN